MDEDLAPATEAELISAIEPVFVYARMFSIPVADVTVTARFYLQTLKYLPVGMAVKAVTRALDMHQSWSRIPLPGEIYGMVGAEYAKLNTFRSSLGLAIAQAENASG